MPRALAAATLALLLTASETSAQTLSVLHIKVTLADAQGRVTPVPRHSLLISDNPATAAPRLIITGLDGTADVRLRPGSYTVESDKPVAFEGKSYDWTQVVEIVAGRDGVLELNARNAEAGAITADATRLTEPLENDPLLILQPFQDSVVALWTPTTRGSGFIADANGLVVTSQRVVGGATSVEVQLTPTVKVAARVLEADAARDVAVLWIDPKAIGSTRVVPLGCAPPAKPPLTEGQSIFTIGWPLSEPKGLNSGAVSRVEGRAIVTNFILGEGSAGGPVFDAHGAVVGLTSAEAETRDRRRERFDVVRLDEACEVAASAAKKMTSAAPPNGTHLPVESARTISVETLAGEAKRRTGSTNPYPMSTADFDVAFITPVVAYAAQQRESRTGPLDDFGNWSAYVEQHPPVLLVRVTPKMVQGFWTTVARGAAMTQGIAVPAIKHFKTGFSKVRAFCGDNEVTPIHPFALEHRVSETEVISEGLYVFDPAALGPECASVKLMLYSEKAPEKGETRIVDSKLIQQIAQDFAAYRN
jgi:S1-C subfamily serine protease